MKKLLCFILVASSLAVTGCIEKKADENTIATVGKKHISKVQLEERIKQYPTNYQETLKDKNNQLRILDLIIDETLLVSEAEANGYTKSLNSLIKLKLQSKIYSSPYILKIRLIIKLKLMMTNFVVTTQLTKLNSNH